MNVVAYASLAFLIVSILACSFVAYRVRPAFQAIEMLSQRRCVPSNYFRIDIASLCDILFTSPKEIRRKRKHASHTHYHQGSR